MLQEKIIEASVTLFFKSGIKAVSMDDVARQVGISKRTLYEYFSSKDVLLVACIDELNNRRVARMEEYISKQSTFFDFMIASTMDSLEFFQTVSPDFLNDLKRFKYDGAREKFSKQLEESRKNLHDLIEDGKRNGYIERCSERLQIPLEHQQNIPIWNSNVSTVYQCFKPWSGSNSVHGYIHSTRGSAESKADWCSNKQVFAAE